MGGLSEVIRVGGRGFKYWSLVSELFMVFRSSFWWERAAAIEDSGPVLTPLCRKSSNLLLL